MKSDTRRQLDTELNSLIAQAEALRHLHYGDFDPALIPDYAAAMKAGAERASSLLEEFGELVSRA